MQRTAVRRAGLVVAPLLLAAAGAVVTATPAAAAGSGGCVSIVSCASNNNGTIGAGASYVRITVNGGNYGSPGGKVVSVPNAVPPPCWYNKGRSGSEMYSDSKDPYYYGLAHHVGDDHDDWFPPEVADHKDDDGNWYSWECSSGNFDGSIQDFFKYVDQWTADNPDLVWVPAGQLPPQPPVPPQILVQIAREYLEQLVRMPEVNFNPAERSFVRLSTWMWFDPAAWQDISVTAQAGGPAVTVTASPNRVAVSGVPAGSLVDTRCAGGGKPYRAGGTTDCQITFSEASGTQPGQQWHFQVSLTWNVTATNATLEGPPTITRAGDQALTVLEAQAVAGNPTPHN
jgi:hypothetical protein